MATTTYKFTGPVKWAKVWPGQLDTKFATGSPSGGHWSVIMNLDEHDANLFNGLGVKGKAGSEEDVAIDKIKRKEKSTLAVGDVVFRRYEKHPKKGLLGAPKVTGVDEGTPIGNGSVCTVELEVYSYPAPDGTYGFGGRLTALEVNNLVEYVKPDASEGPPVG